MQYRDPRAAEARRLRLEQNLASKEIRERLGVDKNKLQYWLAGLPASHGLRSTAKDGLKAEARRLRAEGSTYPAIAELLGVSQSTISLWVRDVTRENVPAPGWSRQARQRRTENLRHRRSVQLEQRERRRQLLVEELSPTCERELLMAGAVAYWCEGAKFKPLNRSGVAVDFTNSDPDLIRLFLRFLAIVPVSHGGPSYWLHIHETADEAGAVAFWCRELGVTSSDFLPTLFKRHKPSTVRKNRGEGYHGCLVVRVRKATELYWYIEDLAKASLQVLAGGAPDSTSTSDYAMKEE